MYLLVDGGGQGGSGPQLPFEALDLLLLLVDYLHQFADVGVGGDGRGHASIEIMML